DVTVPGEARAAAQSVAPAAHAAHAVRGAPETVANLAAQILRKLEGKSTRFDVQLDPHGLGKVDVRIEIGAQGRITAGMTFDNPQAAADVKARASELHRALEQAGFDISGGISFDVADDRGRQQQQDQAWQDQGDASRAFRGQAFRAALETAGDAADAANQGALRLRRGVNAGLDVRI
ncbi:MAG TPA: flagellar hook-length control protein FliK, partial [Phenylobacterium sp.]|nr:flagellar hook-length control protein FliK [Phenylobacterium sp.]